MAYFLISSFALLMLSLFTGLSLGLQVQRCDTCSTKVCVQPICKGGLVFDECDCCLVCAKIEGEKCGGAWGIYGSCEDGLYCHVDPSIGGALLEDDDGNRAGICTATTDSLTSSSRQDCVQKLFSGCNIDTDACQCDDDVLACDNPFTYANFGLCQDAIWQIARAANGSPTGSIPPPALLKLFDSSEDKDCSNIKCVIVDIQCPNDSIIVTPPRDPTECCDPPPTCRCDTSLCDDLICAGGYEKVLISAGDGQPGTCCDNFQCEIIAPSSDCSNIECPPSLPSLCPVNSRYISGGLSEDGCCLLPNRCECAVELCVPQSCDQGYELRLIAEGKEDPENCCPVYKCISLDVKGGCVYPEISYEHGETWQPDSCQLCQCRNGISHCTPVPDCEDSPTIIKALCEVDGKLYANGDQWDQDDCTTCRCVDSKVQCTGASCSISCKNPRKVPGVCCPVCDEPDVITIRPSKCGNFNCSLHCPLGFTRDIEGCPQCHCSQVLCPELESCELSCANGFAEDEQGCRICQCMPDPSKCQTINTCGKFCIYGFQKDRWGCPRCKCERCPNLVDCDLQCPNGFRKNDRGCNICRCGDSAKPDTVLLTLGSCQSYSGKVYEDSESWHDGCRECYCHNGQEMCSLITCSVPACTSPVIRAGECCPTCPDSETNTITQINLKVCHSTEGHYYVEGEAWNIDMCTKCVCHDGHVLCSAETCPPLPCNHPSINDNECCPHCPELINIDGSGGTDSMPCELTDGSVYEDGSTWKDNDCTSCKCEMGEVNCFSITCPPTTCKTPVLRKGQCCPTCLEEPVTNCEYAGSLYSDGQFWTIDSCTVCVCKQGISVCKLPDCPHLQCPDTVLLPWQCCPICQQGARTTTKTFGNARSQNPYKMFTHVPTRITIPESDLVRSSFPVLPVILAVLVILLALLIVIAMFLYVTKWRHRVDYQIKAKTLPTPPVTIMSIKKKNVDNIKNSNRDSIRDSASFKDNKVQGNMYHDTKRNLDTIDMKRLSDYYGVGKSIQPV